MSARGVIAAGIRQVCSDLASEYGYHEPLRDISLLDRFHNEAFDIADYIADALEKSGALGVQEEQQP